MMSMLLSQMATDAWRGLTAVAAALAGYVVRLLKEWRYRSDIHKLHGLSDRQLSDIGLSRSRIEDAVRGDVQRDSLTGGRLRSLLHR
jgi:uncharacterized protein YjiS (DUF1127 family)